MTMTDDRPDAPGPSAASSRPNGIAARLAAVVEPLFGGRLPVRLKAWDGTVAGPTDAPTVVLRDPAALRRLLRHPGELGLAQAYVTGELDVEGDLLDGFRRVWSTARTLAGGRPSAATLASVARPQRHRAPLQPVQRLLRAHPRPADGVLLRLLDERRAGLHGRGRPARQA